MNRLAIALEVILSLLQCPKKGPRGRRGKALPSGVLGWEIIRKVLNFEKLSDFILKSEW